jgi:hypothetical protein
MPTYDTLTEALTDLHRRNYTLDYNLVNGVARCEQVQEELRPEQLVIKKVYRFEGDSNPDDNMVLYALQSRLNPAHKGVLVAAFGPAIESAAAEFLQRLHKLLAS